MHRSCLLVEQQRHHGYVWHIHPPGQLWFPQVAAPSRQGEDLSESLFKTDVKMRAQWHGGRGWEWCYCRPPTEMLVLLGLIGGETSPQFNPPRLIERLLNDQVVKQLNLSSCSCSRGSTGSKAARSCLFGSGHRRADCIFNRNQYKYLHVAQPLLQTGVNLLPF